MKEKEYEDILSRRLDAEVEENKLKVAKMPQMIKLQQEETTLNMNLNKNREKQDELLKLYKAYRGWQDKDKIIQNFRMAWDKMSLMLDSKKDGDAKIKLLKEFKLYE